MSPHRPPRVERRQPADQRQVHLDEVARTDEPEHRDADDDPDLRAEARQETRGTGAQLEGRALGNLVELLALGEGGRESHPVADRLFDLDLVLGDGQDAPGAVEPLAQQRRQESLETAGPADLEAVQLNVGEHSDRDALAAALADALAVVEDPAPRAQDRAGPVGVGADECDDEFHHVDERQRRQGQQGRAPTPARGDHQQLVTALQVLAARAPRAYGADRPLAGGDGLSVGHLGRRRDHDPGAGGLGAPADVQILAESRDQRVEAPQRREEVAADQCHAAGRDEDVALEVLLAVVDLAGLHPLLDHAELVARLAHVQQHQGVVVVHVLRRHDSGVGTKGRLHHLLDGVGFQAHIIVAEQEERRPFDHEHRLVAGGGESLVLVQRPHEGVGGNDGDPCRNVFRLPVRHDEQA